jgi:hypothetical protein
MLSESKAYSNSYYIILHFLIPHIQEPSIHGIPSTMTIGATTRVRKRIRSVRMEFLGMKDITPSSAPAFDDSLFIMFLFTSSGHNLNLAAAGEGDSEMGDLSGMMGYTYVQPRFYENVLQPRQELAAGMVQ